MAAKFSLKVWVASMLMYPLYIEIALVVEKRWARLAALTVFLFFNPIFGDGVFYVGMAGIICDSLEIQSVPALR